MWLKKSVYLLQVLNIVTIMLWHSYCWHYLQYICLTYKNQSTTPFEMDANLKSWEIRIQGNSSFSFHPYEICETNVTAENQFGSFILSSIRHTETCYGYCKTTCSHHFRDLPKLLFSLDDILRSYLKFCLSSSCQNVLSNCFSTIPQMLLLVQFVVLS
jgi:hypothetical protein